MNNNFLNYDELLKKKFKSLGSNVKISKNVTIIGENKDLMLELMILVLFHL